MKGYPTEVKAIGDHLKKRRIDLNLKQREVAIEIGVCFASIQLWERGIGEPGVKQFPAIIRFLGYVPFPQIVGNGGRIAYLRQCAGLTQDELATAMQCDPGTIGRWERGRPGIRTSLVKATAILWQTLRKLAIEATVKASVVSGGVTCE
jgi:transcriptional regulator with XRE-family HTH domain